MGRGVDSARCACYAQHERSEGLRPAHRNLRRATTTMRARLVALSKRIPHTQARERHSGESRTAFAGANANGAAGSKTESQEAASNPAFADLRKKLDPGFRRDNEKKRFGLAPFAPNP